jgi:hypothetical protein
MNKNKYRDLYYRLCTRALNFILKLSDSKLKKEIGVGISMGVMGYTVEMMKDKLEDIRRQLQVNIDLSHVLLGLKYFKYISETNGKPVCVGDLNIVKNIDDIVVKSTVVEMNRYLGLYDVFWSD